MKKQIDLNCDMGEGFAIWRLAPDAQIMPLITSANVACGGHAGDPMTILETIRLAKRHQVALGAHVSYPDLAGFGRRSLKMGDDELSASLLYQMGGLASIAASEGLALHHVKAHGALYNDATVDLEVARIIVAAIRVFSHALIIYCPPGSAQERVAAEAGMRVCLEGFADRAYEPSGLLRDRKLPGALQVEPATVAAQAVALAAGNVPGERAMAVQMAFGTICIHSDTPGSLGLIFETRKALEAAGYQVVAP